MRRRAGRLFGRAACCLATAMLVLASNVPTAPPAAADVGTLSGGTTAAVSRTGDTRAIFPMTLSAGIDPSAVQVVLVSVDRGGLQSAAEAAAFEVRWDGQVPAIVLSVTGSRLPRAGTYLVTVKLLAGSARQLVNLTMTRAAATLTVPAHVAVVVERPFAVLPGHETTPTLTATLGPDDSLTALVGAQLDAAAGSITVGSVPVAGKGPDDRAIPVPYAVDDNFPLGVTSRTVRLTSPQLTEPQTVVFDVTVRRTRWLIAVIVIGGLLVGLALRVVIVPLRALLAANQRALDVRAEIAALRAESEDEEFRSDLDREAGRLDRLRGTAAARNGTIDDVVEAKVADAQKALDGRLAAQRTRYLALAELDRDWSLPQQLADDLAVVRGELAAARQRLDARNASAAAHHLALASAAAEELRHSAEDHLAALRDAADTLLTDIGARRSGAIGLLGTAVRLCRAYAQPAADADTVAIVRAAHYCWQKRDEIRAAVEKLAGETEAVAAVLAGHLRPESKQLLDEALHDLGAEVQLEILATTVPRLRRSIEAAISSVSDDPPVQAALAAGDYLAAARAARRAVSRGAALDKESALQAAVPAATTAAAGPPAEPPAALQPAPPRALVRPSLLPRRALTASTVLLLGVIQFAVLSIVLALAAYRLYGDTWIGNVNDIVAVFTWAFALDVTVGGVTAVLAASRPSVA